MKLIGYNLFPGLILWEIFQDLSPNRDEMFAKLRDTGSPHLIPDHSKVR